MVRNQLEPCGNLRYNEIMYTAKQLSHLFHCSIETIRLQSIEFEAYLEPRSNLGKQRTRFYSDKDVEIFAYIHEQKRAGKLYTDIAAGLANGERADWLPDTNTIIVTQQQERGNRLIALQDEVAELKATINRQQGEIAVLSRLLTEREAQLFEAKHRLKLLTDGKGE